MKECIAKRKSITDLFISPYFLIIVVYILTHWALCFVSGVFWDDLSYETHDFIRFKNVAMMTGRPEWLILIPFAWSLPHNSYRILVFIMYGLQCVLFYKILLKTGFLDKNNSLLFSLIYITVPVNDARLLLSNFTYAVGLTMFHISIYLYLYIYKTENLNNGKYIICRIFTLILFCFSFILNSLLFFYYVFFLFILLANYYKEFGKGFSGKKLLYSMRMTFVGNLDFLAIPLLFFFVKNICFPVYGVYADYNKINFSTLFVSVIKTFVLIPATLEAVLLNYINRFNSVEKILMLIVGCFVFLRSLPQKNDQIMSIRRNVYILLVAFFVLFMGIFPYVAVGRSSIDTTGVQGRDSILLSFGIAIVIYALTNYCSDNLKNTVCAVLILLGALHFNLWYWEYQKDYYNQLSFEAKIDLPYIRSHQNFIVINKSRSKIEGDRFYSFSHNARHVFDNKENHVFLCGLSDLAYLKTSFLSTRKECMLDGWKDIDSSYNVLDGILIFESNISKKNALKMKVEELFFLEKFRKSIYGSGKLELIELSPMQSESLKKKYDDGTLENEEDLILFLRSISNKI